MLVWFYYPLSALTSFFFPCIVWSNFCFLVLVLEKSRKHNLRNLDVVGDSKMGCMGSDGEDELRISSSSTSSTKKSKFPKKVKNLFIFLSLIQKSGLLCDCFIFLVLKKKVDSQFFFSVSWWLQYSLSCLCSQEVTIRYVCLPTCTN